AFFAASILAFASASSSSRVPIFSSRSRRRAASTCAAATCTSRVSLSRIAWLTTFRSINDELRTMRAWASTSPPSAPLSSPPQLACADADLSRRRPVDQLAIKCLGGGMLGDAGRELRLEVGADDPHEQLSGRYPVALRHRHALDDPGDRCADHYRVGGPFDA